MRALRWNPERGFYVRPSTKITEIFFNEGHAPIHSQRTEVVTRVHAAVDGKQQTYKKVTGIAVVIIALIGLGFWFTDGDKTVQEQAPEQTLTLQKDAATNPVLPVNNTANSAVVNTPNAAPVVVSENTADGSQMAAIDMNAATTSEAASSAPIITYALHVKTVPAQARVRVLNIPERYEPGMQLPPGTYHIEVSHPGYDMQRNWVEISDQDLSPAYTLSESLKPGEAMSSQLVAAIKSQGPEMVRIPTGSFLMGHKDDILAMPVHKVTIGKNIAMSKYEITFDDYDIFAQTTNRALPNDNRWGRGNRPVINVSFEDARAYARWLSETTGKKYRLPTEAEWEYVARAETNTLFWWGNDAKDAAGRANCRRGCNSKFSGLFGAKTAPVGTYPANGFGIYDTAGNVAEWVEDCFADNYNLHPKNGQALLVKSCDARVVRGGSAKDNADELASHKRDYHHAEIFDAHLGFRVVMDL